LAERRGPDGIEVELDSPVLDCIAEPGDLGRIELLPLE
jgi:hypothetical protein